MMDLRHLESDELELEFSVRKLNPRDDGAMETLARFLIDEKAGGRNLPSLPPFYKTSSDITLCKRKINQIENQRLELADLSDEPALSALRSRTLHLISRLERLASYDAENRAITKILEEARKLWDRLVPARLVDVESDISDEAAFAGFTASGIAAPPPCAPNG